MKLNILRLCTLLAAAGIYQTMPVAHAEEPGAEAVAPDDESPDASLEARRGHGGYHHGYRHGYRGHYYGHRRYYRGPRGWGYYCYGAFFGRVGWYLCR